MHFVLAQERYPPGQRSLSHFLLQSQMSSKERAVVITVFVVAATVVVGTTATVAVVAVVAVAVVAAAAIALVVTFRFCFALASLHMTSSRTRSCHF